MPTTLIIVPSVPAAPDGDRLFMDIKALDGLTAYARGWPGPVRCLFRRGDRGTIAFGTSIAPADYPFDLVLVGDDPAADMSNFADAAVVLAAGDNHQDLQLVDAVSAPVVFIIEYTLATRLQITRLSMGVGLRAAKSLVWTIKTELRRRRTFRRSSGLQCNGTPAHAAYRRLAPNSLLYFDTRVPDALQIDAAQLAAKTAAMVAGDPLRIAFSGRLEPMKGADHLVKVAKALRNRGVPFSLDIYGDGSLRAAIVAEIAASGLDGQVAVKGPVPFDTVLVPKMIGEVDLFLCCHRQADPSCTYLETLSCGVPIVGYDNAAFRGVVELGDVGIAVPVDDPAAAAAAIADLASDRPRLVRMAGTAAKVGAAHSFEKVFATRLAHLREIAGL
ncbi:glycosyltransferase [Sphingomonas sp. KR1UV-12]|uniref:Glycosyltransferase n=1 Tax=Sphingomonas aurea TaxID=3063994 RepID=A0ABT9EFK6_9SPHN|nr:glycosyltransferase [Sphingomonas sp. KR1UV-12]MDP1025751.1 glycosyltransferase [Sphingomonas sp. KR1UV-12]